MSSKTSNQQMENSLELLNSIRTVTPPKDLLLKIERKIENNKQNVIPLRWVKAAAAIFICVFFTEVYLLSNKTQADDLSELIVTVDYTLYNE
jgi:hypothetical protein